MCDIFYSMARADGTGNPSPAFLTQAWDGFKKQLEGWPRSPPEHEDSHEALARWQDRRVCVEDECGEPSEFMLLDVELPGVAELARCWYSKRLRAADSDPAYGKGG